MLTSKTTISCLFHTINLNLISMYRLFISNNITKKKKLLIKIYIFIQAYYN